MFFQSRVVCCIFYSLNDINLFIDKFHFNDYEYAYIYHDKDRNLDGSLKEPHYHFYGRRNSPITEQSLINFSKKCEQNIFYENLKSNRNAFVEYLTHSNNADKYQYPKSDIISNFDIDSRIVDLNKIDNSQIISMFDNGFTTLDIIHKFPKLLYSIASLQRFEKLVVAERRRRDFLLKCPDAIKQVELVDSFPFD